MKKSELKEMIKPIVKECVKEALLESGVVSQTVNEVMKGIMPILTEALQANSKKVVTERVSVPNESSKTKDPIELYRKKRKALREVGSDAYSNVNLPKMEVNGVNIFEGTKPARGEASPEQRAGALSDSDPEDPGVDLSLFGF